MSIAGFSFGVTRAERRRGVRAAEALGRAEGGSPASAAAVAARAMARLLAHQGGEGLRLHAARRCPSSATRTASSSSSRTAASLGHDALMAARNQLLGLAAKDPRAREGAARRPRGHAAVQDRRRPAEGLRARRLPRRRERDARLDLGRRLRERLHRQGAHEARLHAGRRAVPHEARRTSSRWYVRNAAARWSRSPPSPPGELDLRARPSSSASTASPPWRSRASRRRGAAPARRWRRIEGIVAKLPRRRRGSSGRGSRTRSGSRARNAPALYALSLLVVFLCLAALYESWSIPVSVLLVVPARRARRGGRVLAARARRTTCTSRSACSRPWASRPRTPSSSWSSRKELHERGMTVVAAALEAARMRLRPDHHDVARVHPRRLAARARERRRRRGPERHRHRGHRRHALGDGARDPVRAAVLRPHRAARRRSGPRSRRREPKRSPARRPRRRPPMRSRRPAAAAALLLGACSLAPRYQRPAAPVAGECRAPSRPRPPAAPHGGRPRLARRVRGRAPAGARRARAREQPRSPRGRAERGAHAGAVPHPARGAAPRGRSVARARRASASAAT